MPFCRAMLSAKRFIAGVGGRTPASPPTSGAEQRRSSGSSAFRELADDALSDIAHGINRADHLLLADHDLVEQAFELRRYARVDQRRIGLLENPEQRQAQSRWGRCSFPGRSENPVSSARR